MKKKSSLEIAKRLIVLDQMMRNSRGFTKSEILECDEYPVYEDKTFYNDIEELERFGAVIPKKRTKDQSYKYQDPNFTILDHPDLAEIKASIMTNIKAIDDAFDDLDYYQGNLNYDMIRLYLKAFKSGLTNARIPFMSFDLNPDYIGRQHIETVAEAIINKQVLRIGYAPFHSTQETSPVVHPYFLKQFNNRWFLFAWSESHNEMRNYPLDRIKQITTIDQPYRSPDVDFNDYFDDIVGVTNRTTDKVEKVLLRIDRKSIEYIRTKPLHWSQKELKTRETSDSVFVELDVKVNQELKMLLLSYSDAIEVLEPQHLKDTIIKRIKNMTSFYHV